MTDQKLYTIPEAAKSLPNRPATSTVWRWILKGVRGVRLESRLLGGRRYTTEADLEAFFQGVEAASRGERPAARTPRRRQRDIGRAEQELAKAGI